MAQGFRWWIGHLEEILCASLFAVMAIVMFVNIIARYLLKYSLAFTEELVVSLFVWVTLLGASIAFRQQSHLGFSFLIQRLPRNMQRILLWLSAVLGAFLFGVLIYFAIRQIGDEISLGITSSGIGLPQWWYTIGVPVWSCLVIARIFQGAYSVSAKLGKE